MSAVESSHTAPANLLGLDPAALGALVAEWGDKPFRARQLLRWIHQQGVVDFADMTDLAKSFRERLQQRCTVRGPALMIAKRAADDTRKWLFDMGRGNAIEAVFIPEEDRGTLCISSQAGCAVGCVFCSTGYQGFSRNLTTAEIVGQLWFANQALRDDPSAARLGGRPLEVGERPISNVVMMGMGEPLLNYDQVLGALRLMVDDHAYGLSRRRVTVSTSGVVPMIERLAHDCPVALAVSLHAPTDALRSELVPLNRKYPLAELLDACNLYLEYAPRDFITFEYVMLDGINDGDEQVRGLIEVARQVRCKFNLIPFNPFPQSGLKCSPAARIRLFARQLQDAGLVVTVRKTRGEDIDAACGQLAGEVQDRTRIVARRRARPTVVSEKKVPAYEH